MKLLGLVSLSPKIRIISNNCHAHHYSQLHGHIGSCCLALTTGMVHHCENGQTHDSEQSGL